MLRLCIVPELSMSLVMMTMLLVMMAMIMSLIAEIKRKGIQQRLFFPVGTIFRF